MGSGASVTSAVAGVPVPFRAMKRMMRRLALAALVLFAGLLGCEAFTDPTPSNISFEMRGDAGKQVRVIYSKQFVAGATETGVTRVQVVAADTVLYTLPVDTLIDISVERRWFVQAESVQEDTLAVSVRIDVDNRNLLSESGGIFPGEPWHFVYAFNHQYTRALDVEL